MAAVSGPTQEASGPLLPVADQLPGFLTRNSLSSCREASRTDSPGDFDWCKPRGSVLTHKREANALLPIVAAAYASGELNFESLVDFFRNYAHLYSVGIDTNALCNLACGYCYLESYNPDTVSRYADLEYFYKILQEAKNADIDLVALVGKEPFADERGIGLLRFLDSLSESGSAFRYGVVTNGTLIDRYVSRLPKSLAYVDISLDGPELPNDLVRGKGVFRRASRNIRSLVDLGYEVWTSSVLHTWSADSAAVSDFVRRLVCEYGCSRFYFSPVRNFTGSLHPFLLSFDAIARIQDELVEIAERTPGVQTVILDHPYEAVWRDYIWPVREGRPFSPNDFVVDQGANVLRKLSSRCFQKLDIFPHGPWATCRVDAQGMYLADVESRTYAQPAGIGSIAVDSIYSLFTKAVNNELVPMLRSFLANMYSASQVVPTQAALSSVSMPPVIQRESIVAAD